jgi:hypothetical protein
MSAYARMLTRFGTESRVNRNVRPQVVEQLTFNAGTAEIAERNKALSACSASSAVKRPSVSQAAQADLTPDVVA